MVTISLCMIVKNEEKTLERCLESIKKAVDEIIIVDTGSFDRTKEIAKKYTEKIYDFTWDDDFSAARNYSFAKATMDFCMWMDADDLMPQESLVKFIEYKKTLSSSIDTVMMKYNISFDTNDNPTFSYYRERIIKNCKNAKWEGEIHEVIIPFGNIVYTDIAISHKKIENKNPSRNLYIYEKILSSGKSLGARHQFYYSKELYYNGKYYKAIDEFEKFLNDKSGWIENKIDACEHLSYCYGKVGNINLEILSLFRSFEYDVPRAEICCDIGNYFFRLNKYKQAVFWYKMAASIKKTDNSLGFIKNDCYDYIPYIQLCVCYYRLGNAEKSIEYNNLAKNIKPYDPAVKQNLEFFKTLTAKG